MLAEGAPACTAPPATPVPTTVKGRALVHVRGILGALKQPSTPMDSPLEIQKANKRKRTPKTEEQKSADETRKKEAMAKRMRNHDMVKAMKPHGIESLKDIDTKLSGKIAEYDAMLEKQRKLLAELVDKQRESLSQTDKATAMQREYAGKQAFLDSREKDLDRRERAMETEKARHIEMKAMYEAQLTEVQNFSKEAEERDKEMKQQIEELHVARCRKIEEDKASWLRHREAEYKKLKAADGKVQRQNNELTDENAKLTAKLRKIETRKRSHKEQENRRAKFRNLDNDQQTAKSAAATKQKGGDSSNSTTGPNKFA